MPLYQEISPYRTGYLPLSDSHSMYFEESGNPHGIPVLHIHAGPGSCSSDKHRRYTNPNKVRCILFDQRGCGKSKPFGSLKANTTQHLIEDIEKLRQHLGIDKWFVVGFSWGCTLSLAYAETYPNHVLGITTGGCFLGTKRESDWLFGPDGISRFFPNEYRALQDMVGNSKPSDLTQQLLAKIQNSNPKQAGDIAKAVGIYECLASEPNPDYQAILTEAQTGQDAITSTSIFLHYDIHKYFLKPNQIMNQLHRIHHIPMFIVQGALDMVCPPETAIGLHAAHPNSHLTMVPLCGHRADTKCLRARVRAIKNMLRS